MVPWTAGAWDRIDGHHHDVDSGWMGRLVVIASHRIGLFAYNFIK
jgi:hypothetical protein